MTAGKPTRVVILGGGFAGVHTARQLEKLSADRENIEITLVSRDNYFLMTPLLFEAGSGILEPRHSVEPIRLMLDRTRFVEAEVEGVDLGRQMVLARPAPDEIYEIPYDHLVLALGGVTNREIVEGSEHAMTFKTLADAIFLRNYVIELFERADVEEDPQRKQALLTFVIIGGGLVGIELLGELTIFTRNLCRSYPRVGPADLRFDLIDAGPRIMREMDEDLAAYAAKVLRRRGVNIHSSCPVQSIQPDRVRLPDGESIAAETVILATGVSPSPLVRKLDVAKDRKGRVLTEPTLRCTSHPNIWALGDCAAVPGPDGKPYPALAQHALREARILACNVIAALHHRPLQPFVYQTLGTLAALGHYKGVGRIMRFKFRGFLAWWIWRTYYLMRTPRWERRLRIVLDWTIALFFKNDIVKLDLFGEEHLLRRYEQRRMSAAKAQREVIGGRQRTADG